MSVSGWQWQLYEYEEGKDVRVIYDSKIDNPDGYKNYYLAEDAALDYVNENDIEADLESDETGIKITKPRVIFKTHKDTDYTRPPDNIILIDDTPDVSMIREMVQKIGWKRFVDALQAYTSKKIDEMRSLGLEWDADYWEKICNKIKTIGRRAQI